MLGFGELIVIAALVPVVAGFIGYRIGLRVGRAEGQVRAQKSAT
jgi:hypothetical protein